MTAPPRHSLDELPQTTDGAPNTHRFTYDSILLRAGGCVRNGYANPEVSQLITCLLYALDQLNGDYLPTADFLRSHAENYWLRLPKLPLPELSHD